MTDREDEFEQEFSKMIAGIDQLGSIFIEQSVIFINYYNSLIEKGCPDILAMQLTRDLHKLHVSRTIGLLGD